MNGRLIPSHASAYRVSSHGVPRIARAQRSPWLVDAKQFSALLERHQSALQRPPSFSGSLNPSLLAFDRASIHDSIAAVADSAQHTHVDLRRALAGFETHAIDRAHQARLTSLVNELTTLWSVRATMTLGLRRSAVLRRIPCSEPMRSIGM